MSEKNWRDMYRDVDEDGDKVLDVWMRDGKAVAYEYKDDDGHVGIVSDRSRLVPLPPPRRYTFMEAVGMMERGKKMRPLRSILTEYSQRESLIYDQHGNWPSVNEIKGPWEEVADEPGR
jgi:hypothetical protein